MIKTFADLYGLSQVKKWVLLCESGTHVFSYQTDVRAIDINVLIDERNFKENDLLLWNEHIKETMKTFHDQLGNLSESFFEDYELIYRAHPGETVDTLINDNVKRINDKSISEWFSVIDLCISRHSTVLFEAEASKVPTICYNPCRTPKRILIKGFEHYRQIKNLDEINDQLIVSAKNDLLKKNIYENYIGKVDGKCDKRIANLIKEIIKTDLPNYNKNEIKVRYIKTLVRKILSNLFARFVIKYRIKILEKFSKSIVALRTDIPQSG